MATMSNNPAHPQSKRGNQLASNSIPTSPQVSHNNNVMTQSQFTNPYHATYPINPASFSYPPQYLPQPTSMQQMQHQPMQFHPPPHSPSNQRKRRASELDDGGAMHPSASMSPYPGQHPSMMPPTHTPNPANFGLGQPAPPPPQAMKQEPIGPHQTGPVQPAPGPEPGQGSSKKGRTNTPWTPAEEQRLKQMRETGNSWSEIAKAFPARTEGSVKKHWYKDMHYAEFTDDEGSFKAALAAAIKEYEASKWKVVGQKVGKPAKACEQYYKEHLQKS